MCNNNFPANSATHSAVNSPVNSYIPIATADGSMTLLNHENLLHFRSLRGARSESEYVFFESSGLQHQTSPWRVLELGLGTGLNFLVTAQHALNANIALDYHVVEADPIPATLLKQLKYPQLFAPELCELLYRATEASTVKATSPKSPLPQSFQNKNIRLTLYTGRWQDTLLPEDLRVYSIYHDPFGPKDNPDCWTEACFLWSSKHLLPEGRLATYAANTALRREMVNAGLFIASRRGSQLKREMSLAAHSLAALKGDPTIEIQRKKTYYLERLSHRPSREALL